MSPAGTADGAGPRPRLLVLASTYPRWQDDHEPGFVHALSRGLSARFDVTVLCPHAPGAAPREVLDGVQVVRYRYAPAALEVLVNDGGIVGNLRRRPWTLLLVPGFVLGQLLALRRLLRAGTDVVHAHWIIPQAFTAALLGLTGTRLPPMLVTSHGADLFALRGGLLSALKRFALRRCQAATVVSTAMLEPIIALGMPADRVQVAPMGVDMSGRFTPDPAVTRSRSELLFVGRLVEKKGLAVLIDALPRVLARHPDVSLTIAGFGPELEARQAQVRALGLDSHVRFLGAVQQDALPALYRRAAMLVAPFVQARSGDREGLGLVSVEALACGCPVVTTRIDAVREVFDGQWPDYMAECGDARSLAEQVCAVLEAPEVAARGVARLQESLRAKFSGEAVAAGYGNLLAGLASRRIMLP